MRLEQTKMGPRGCPDRETFEERSCCLIQLARMELHAPIVPNLLFVNNPLLAPADLFDGGSRDEDSVLPLEPPDLVAQTIAQRVA